MEDIDKSEQVILLFDEKAQDKLFTAVKFGKEEDIHAVIRKMKEISDQSRYEQQQLSGVQHERHQCTSCFCKTAGP